jgi:hypothetical protein
VRVGAGLGGLVSVAHAIDVEAIRGGGRLVAYTPRGGDPSVDGPPHPASLRADAETLRALGFTAVVTSGTSRTTAPVCRVFKRHGFRAVLVGVWDPRDRGELARARALRRCTDGYVVGTEGLGAGRYGRDELTDAVRALRRATGRPVTTRETPATYADDPALLRLGDWLFPAVQPWPEGHRDSQDACGWTIFAWRDLAARAPAGIPTVIGATGLPTEGAPAALEHYQRAFFLCLESRQVDFAYWEAFDEPWRTGDPVAPHFGLFRADGSPKLWAAQQLKPRVRVRRGRRTVHGRIAGVPATLVHAVVYAGDGPWRLVASVPHGRRGKWRAVVPPGRAVTDYAATAAWKPPAEAARLPTVDRAAVLARGDLPAM